MADSPTLRVVKGSSEGDINSVNQWMRSQPWYQALLQSWGVNPSSVKLSEAQRQAVIKAAQANGVQVDQGNIEVDPAGNFNPIGHKLRNTLIAAGVAGAAIGAPYLIGALTSGGAVGGTAAASGAGASGAAAGTAGAAAVPTLTAGIPSAAGLGAGSALVGVPASLTAPLTVAGAGVGGGSLAGSVGTGLAASTGTGVAPSVVPSVTNAAAPSLWSKIAGPLISTAVPAVAGVIGTKMQVDANKQAADVQAKAAQDALDWQKQQYAIRQQQLAPTIGVGNASRTRLGELMGIATPDGGWQAPAATQVPMPTSVPPAGQTPSSATATPNSAIATPQLVTMRAPTGQVSQVPADQVAHYQQQGAQVVPAGLPAH